MKCTTQIHAALAALLTLFFWSGIGPPCPAYTLGALTWRPVSRAPDKAPVPEPDALEHARKELRETVYPKQYALTRKPKRRELAQRLLADSEAIEGTGAVLFVLLDEARALAVLGRDVETALDAVDRLGTRFDIDGRTMRIDTVEQILDAATSGDRDLAIKVALDLYQSCLSDLDTESAQRLAHILDKPLRRSSKLIPGFRDTASALRSQLDEYIAAKAALAKLREGEANSGNYRIAGMFQCFRVGDFDTGLPLLAEGPDKTLARLARLDQAADRADPNACIEVAEMWHGVAKQLPAYATVEALGRARSWCQYAMKGAEELVMLRANRLSEEIESDLARVTRALNGLASGNLHSEEDDLADEPSATGSEAWAAVLEREPDKRLVTNPLLYRAIKSSGYPWKVRHRRSGVEMLLVPMDPEARTFLYVGQYETQEKEWLHVLKGDPLPRGKTIPALGHGWDAVHEFLKTAGDGLRLPTEAEWIAACRAWAQAEPSENLEEFAWHVGNSGGVGHTVGEKLPNAAGLYDMLGNAYEWTQARSVRGGSWCQQAERCRSTFRMTAFRDWLDPGPGIGFRVVHDVP